MAGGQRLRVLVTGASSGIGRATALEFARRGHQVFAAARRQAALAALAAETPAIQPAALDVTDAASVRAAWAAIEADTGGAGVDVLVNNAGFALTGPVETLDPADVRRQFDTNVIGLLHVTRAVLPAMRQRRSGRIINVSSVLGRTTFPGAGAYGATKHAVEALTDALRQELAGFGIAVIAIRPGFVATGLGAAHDARHEPDMRTAEAYAALLDKGEAYLARQVASGTPPERVAAAIADAAERRRPRPAYVVPTTMRPLLALLTTPPTRLTDRIKARALGL